MMRHETRVKVLAGTLAFLVLCLVAGWIFDPARRLERAESARLLAAKKEAVALIEIGGSAGVVLAREGSSWALRRGGESLPAESSRVEAFLDAIVRVARLAPVANSKAAWEGYGLAEGVAKKVTLKDLAGSQLAGFSVGKNSGTGREVYLRVGEAEASFAVDSGFVSYLNYASTDWLDLRIIPEAGGPETVQAVSTSGAIALDGAGKAARKFGWRIERTQSGWVSRPPAGSTASGAVTSIDAVAAESLVRALLNLQGEDIAPRGSAFGTVLATAGLELADGTSRAIEVGAATGAGEGRFHVRLDGGERIWIVSSYALGNAFKELPTLVPTPAK